MSCVCSSQTHSKQGLWHQSIRSVLLLQSYHGKTTCLLFCQCRRFVNAKIGGSFVATNLNHSQQICLLFCICKRFVNAITGCSFVAAKLLSHRKQQQHTLLNAVTKKQTTTATKTLLQLQCLNCGSNQLLMTGNKPTQLMQNNMWPPTFSSCCSWTCF